MPAFTSFEYIAKMGFARSNGNSPFNFLRNHRTVFYHGCTSYIAPSNAEGFRFLHILTNACYFPFCFFGSSHPKEYEGVSHGSFDLYSLMVSGIKYLFLSFLVIYMSSLEKCQIGRAHV